MWVFYRNVCLSTTCTPGAFREQKRVSNAQELDMQMPVSCHVGAEEHRFSGRATIVLNYWATSPIPKTSFEVFTLLPYSNISYKN